MSGPSQNKKAGPSAAANKPRPFKSIRKTADLLQANEAAKRKGKGKETAVLNGLQDLVRATNGLPATVQVERFAETRALEIVAMQNAVKIAASQNSTRSFQSLPRHLRRRAASHNPRRVPKRMRAWAASEIDQNSTIVRQQRKKAKLRAKGNLRGESRTVQLRRRQQDKKWLGTHIYHAKRFHMVNVWGYRIPSTPTLKSFRASYRAARRKATLHDASYFDTIELEGCRHELVTVLGSVTAGGAIAGEKYENGSREAHTYAYAFGAFPLGMIGPVSIIWQPPTQHDSSKRLWLRVHPSITREVLQALRTAVGSRQGASITVRDIRDDIEGFELMGPLAGQVLRRVLDMCPSPTEESRRALESLLLHEADEVPDGLVCYVDVYDPRLSYPPPKVMRNVNQIPALECCQTISSEALSGRLWNAEDRNKLRNPTFKKSDLDMRRREQGLPGCRLRAIAQDDRIPVALIKRSVASAASDEATKAFHGFTLLFPRGWSMAFLPSFMYCGALLGGHRERSDQYREAGLPSFPEHFGSVCAAGASWEAEKAATAEERWLRKPPAKRTQYSTTGIKWPFRPDWQAVLSGEGTLLNCSNVQDQPEEEQSARGEASEPIQPWLFNTALITCLTELARQEAEAPAYLLRAVNVLRRRRSLEELPSRVSQDLFNSAVCHVQLDMVGRGAPSDMAVLCSLDSKERTGLHAYELDADFPHFGIENSEMSQLGQDIDTCEEIGFVNKGSFSMTRGVGHALATVSLKGYLDSLAAARDSGSSARDPIVKVRNVDGTLCRLARLAMVG